MLSQYVDWNIHDKSCSCSIFLHSKCQHNMAWWQLFCIKVCQQWKVVNESFTAPFFLLYMTIQIWAVRFLLSSFCKNPDNIVKWRKNSSNINHRQLYIKLFSLDNFYLVSSWGWTAALRSNTIYKIFIRIHFKAFPFWNRLSCSTVRRLITRHSDWHQYEENDWRKLLSTLMNSCIIKYTWRI